MTAGAAAGRRGTTLGVVFLALFLDCVAFGMLFPLSAELLRFYREHDDGGLFAAALAWAAGLVPGTSLAQQEALFGGLVIGVYSLCQFVSAPWWGRLSDRIGRRPVLLIGLAGTLAANLLWACTASFTWFIAGRILAGAVNGSVVVANAAVGDLVEPARRARAMGLIGMAFGLGFVLGPALGAITYQPGWLDGVGPFHRFSVPALAASLLAAINLLWAWRSFAETLPRGVPLPATGRTANPLALFTGGAGAAIPRINLVFCLYTLLFSGMEATLVFFAFERCGYGVGQVVWVFLAMGLATAAMQGGVFRPLAPRLGVRRMGVAGLALSIPGFALLAMVAGPGQAWALWTGSVVLACATGLTFPALSTLASLAADPARQGEAMGGFRSAGSLGRALGPYLGAVAYFGWWPGAPYLIGAVGLVLPLLLVALTVRVAEPPRAPA